jgi:hypothetical protein
MNKFYLALEILLIFLHSLLSIAACAWTLLTCGKACDVYVNTID